MRLGAGNYDLIEQRREVDAAQHPIWRPTATSWPAAARQLRRIPPVYLSPTSVSARPRCTPAQELLRGGDYANE
jgi:hypothetical protein